MRATEFVDSYIDAWNHRDARLVAEHLARDGTYCDIPDNEQHSGDELVNNLVEFFDLNKHSYTLLGEVLSGKNTIAFQYAVSLQGDESETYYGAEFVTLDGAAAIKILDYYDIPGIASTVTAAHMGKYTKSGLSSSQIENYKQRLTTLMQYENVYRQPDLTLPKLADRVGCSVNHLSQVINSGIGMSFFDYLNQHRVEYAKQLLSKQASQHQSILNIAFTVGFNSNSSFYTAFKKASGKTPAQYRQSRMGDTR